MSRQPIAIVGVSALFPGSTDRRGFWEDILEGRDLVSEIPASHWLRSDYHHPDLNTQDKTYATRGAFLDAVEFDALAWGIPPSIVPATDTSQLLALIVAQRVLEDACGGQFKDMDKSRTSVILGVTSAQELLGTMVSRLQQPVWQKSLRDMGLPESVVQEACERISSHYVPWQESTFPGLLGNVVAGRIANRLDLGGTNCVTDAACASAFAAVQMAVNELHMGQSDLVITGGVDTMNDIFMYMCFAQTTALSRSGDVRPFSDQADGTLLGEGIGMVAMKRLADAERDGDRIYGVLRGVGTSSDGRSKSVYAPVSAGQANALRRAYDEAGYSPRTVELLEAHGTGTKAGDAAEFAGMCMAFEHETDSGWCALGSVKSQVGHTKASAGAAGLFKGLMAVQSGVLPPSIKIDRPNPNMDLETGPFYLSTQARPWVRGSDHPRRAGVSSFGFGGSNFHLTVEEYTGELAADRQRVAMRELVVFSADTPAQLEQVVRGVQVPSDPRHRADFVRRLAWETHQVQHAAKAARAAIIVTDEDDLEAKLTALADHIAAKPTKALTGKKGLIYADGAELGQVGFLFPGQGSQYVGMGAQVAMTWRTALAAWDRAADIDMDGRGLHNVVFPVPVFSDAERTQQLTTLTRTEWAQPAIGACSLSYLAMLRGMGLVPSAVGGHSYGEVTALHAAGVYDEATMLGVARRRGELMAQAAELPGSMTAVVADIDAVRAVVEESGLNVVVANHNSPTQVVLSGATPDIDAVEVVLKDKGLNFTRLQVATAFHSHVVADSVGPFAAFLADQNLSAPTTPVYANSQAAPYPADADGIREILSGQIASSVRFVEQVQAMYDAGVRTFVEVGPHSVLTGLGGRILRRAKGVRFINTDRKGKDGLETFLAAIGQLVVAGAELDLNALWEGYGEPDDTRLRKAPKLGIAVNGSNVGKPYPPVDGEAGLPQPNPEREPEVVIHEVIKEVEVIREVEVVREVPVAAAGVPVAHAPQAVAAAPVSDAFLSTFQVTQNQTMEAHAAYQDAMARTHLAFLNAMQSSMGALSGLVGGGTGVTAQPVYAAPQPVAPAPAPTPVAAPVPVVASAPVVAPDPVAAAPAEMSLDSLLSPAGVPAPTPVAAPAPVAAAPVGLDLNQLLLDVVADKTGYPAEMLNLDMDLEADLGVDSIKRVEILSAMREAAPELPEVDASEMASLKTLGQIVDHMGASMPAVSQAAPAPTGISVDLNALLLSVVADKTGYPAEMLNLDMDLEADLGVDSIKRVEILSAMREAAPELPEVDASEMASLKTLGQIVDHMGASLPAVRQAAPAAISIDLNALLLTVVADKTGYPAEMLNLDMDLEADLGVDSIKRVEILSAMREAAPELPEVDASEMASLRTLGQIVDHMGASLPTVSAPAPVAAAAAPTVDLNGLLLSVVADKTGYPAEMLNLDMDLEADLGIDSIKRVEILSAMREAEPGLPEVDAGAMAALNTLGQIVEYMGESLPTAAPAAAPTAAPSVDLNGLLLSVVADKTGYPAEMLNLEMDLEADLGIDSIKRVEILSAMREAEPGLPEVDASAMAALKTLGQIVEYMAEESGAPAPAAQAAPTKAPVNPDLGRFVLDLVPAEAEGLGIQGLQVDVPVVIVPDDGGVAAALAERLTAAGFQVSVTEQVPAGSQAVIHLGGLNGALDGMAVQRDAFLAAKAIAHDPKLFVTVQDTGGDLGLGGSERAWVGGLTGLVKTAALEWTGAGCKAIDIAGEHKAARIAEELLAGGAHVEVALHADGTRRVPQVSKVSVEGGVSAVDGDSVLVVSGGARGVTASCVIELAGRTGARFLLLGRTALTQEPAGLAGITDDAGLKRALLAQAKASGQAITPAQLNKAARGVLAQREIRATVAAVQAAGGSARYASVDVTDAAAVSAAVATARTEWGPITGVVHAAGVLADRFIADKTPDQFDFVFGTKLNGLRALMDATSGDPLRVFASFSSVAARAGNTGQCDYAMANETLNKVSALIRAQHPGVLVKSFGWGPWEGGMVTPALRARFEAMGVPLIPLDTGAAWFADELLGSDPARIELVLGGEPKAKALLGQGSAVERSFSVTVSADRHGWLVDHAIGADPVVPVVLVLEWFTRAAKATRPDLQLLACEDLKVLKGIRLSDFAAQTVHVHCVQLSNGDGARLALECKSTGGRVHYRATAHMASRAASPAPADRVSFSEPWTDTVYGDVLFHGPELQVIDRMEGVSAKGLRAEMQGTSARAWAEDWNTDVAAMDGGLQLALLWTKHMLGGASLPTAVGRYEGTGELLDGPIRATLTGRVVGGSKALTDIVFETPDGRAVARLEGVETHLLPKA